MQKNINTSKNTNINDMFIIFKPSNSLGLTLSNSFKNLDFTLDLISQNSNTFSSVIQQSLSHNSKLKVIELLKSFQKELDFYSNNIKNTIDFIQKKNMKGRNFLVQNKLEQLDVISQNKTFISSFIRTS